jgi:hypothetical protein
VKIVSANQLKSGDLSIKTAASSDVEALRQFTEDWTHRIGTGASVRIPTYGVLAHGVRTSSMDMARFEENRAQMLQDNRPFIPQAEIKHIGWLTRDASAKPAVNHNHRVHKTRRRKQDHRRRTDLAGRGLPVRTI